MSLKPNNPIATTVDADALMDWLSELPTDDGKRLTAVTAAMMAWNLAAKLIAEANNGEDRT